MTCGDIIIQGEKMKIRLTEMTKSDLKYVARLLGDAETANAMHNAARTLRQLSEVYKKTWSRDRDILCLVIEVDKQPVGWIKINGLESNKTAYISMIAVETGSRSKGTGRNALLLAEKYLRSKKYSFIGAQVTDDNEPAQQLFIGCGYTVSARIDFETDDGVTRGGFMFLKSLE